MKYIPSPQALLEFLIPTYVSGTINGGIVESYASEQGARRTAMESATDNANDMIQKLELSYNRVRQGADRKSTRLNSSHANISYAVFCLKKKKKTKTNTNKSTTPKIYHYQIRLTIYLHHTSLAL